MAVLQYQCKLLFFVKFIKFFQEWLISSAAEAILIELLFELPNLVVSLIEGWGKTFLFNFFLSWWLNAIIKTVKVLWARVYFRIIRLPIAYFAFFKLLFVITHCWGFKRHSMADFPEVKGACIRMYLSKQLWILFSFREVLDLDSALSLFLIFDSCCGCC